MKKNEIRRMVRDRYAGIVRKGLSCCPPAASCCGPVTSDDIGRRIGYSDRELQSVPEGANLGLGCGNPTAIASLKKGEIVLDLGSGPGFDCFLAAEKVGDEGRVIGVDMTPDMVDRARGNARKGNYRNVEFRLGEIENLPAADNSAGVIISNCVINLSPDKARVFRESFRVLKPGGRLIVSDIVLLTDLPRVLKDSMEAYAGCIAGAMLKEDYLGAIRNAGFEKVEVLSETAFPLDLLISDPIVAKLVEESDLTPEELAAVEGSVVSITVRGNKPVKTAINS